jgi:hypothetical protein
MMRNRSEIFYARDRRWSFYTAKTQNGHVLMARKIRVSRLEGGFILSVPTALWKSHSEKCRK